METMKNFEASDARKTPSRILLSDLMGVKCIRKKTGERSEVLESPDIINTFLFFSNCLMNHMLLRFLLPS